MNNANIVLFCVQNQSNIVFFFFIKFQYVGPKRSCRLPICSLFDSICTYAPVCYSSTVFPWDQKPQFLDVIANACTDPWFQPWGIQPGRRKACRSTGHLLFCHRCPWSWRVRVTRTSKGCGSPWEGRRESGKISLMLSSGASVLTMAFKLSKSTTESIDYKRSIEVLGHDRGRHIMMWVT